MCLKVISFMNKMNMKLKKKTPGKSDATDDTKYTSNITPP